jgi:plasmid stabilization system protein ParE
VPRYQVEVHPEAEEDARSIYLWIYGDSPQSAEEFALVFESAIENLGDTAHTWDAKRELKRFLINYYKVTLIYRIRGDVVTIGAVAHQRRTPGFWKSRSF